MPRMHSPLVEVKVIGSSSTTTVHCRTSASAVVRVPRSTEPTRPSTFAVGSDQMMAIGAPGAPEPVEAVKVSSSSTSPVRTSVAFRPARGNDEGRRARAGLGAGSAWLRAATDEQQQTHDDHTAERGCRGWTGGSQRGQDLGRGRRQGSRGRRSPGAEVVAREGMFSDGMRERAGRDGFRRVHVLARWRVHVVTGLARRFDRLDAGVVLGGELHLGTAIGREWQVVKRPVERPVVCHSVCTPRLQFPIGWGSCKPKGAESIGHPSYDDRQRSTNRPMRAMASSRRSYEVA